MLLAVDTSTTQIGLALYDGAQVVAESLWSGKARHTVELAAAVSNMLAHTALKTSDLKALGVASGPGSFTSLRVGISFIKGLALACSLPVIGINALDVVAASQPVESTPLVCLLPAGRSRMACGWYKMVENKWQASGNLQVITAEALAASIEEKCVICGDLTAKEREIFKKNALIQLVSPALSVRRPALLAELAFERWQAGDVNDVSTLAPIYLHIADPIPDVISGSVTTHQDAR